MAKCFLNSFVIVSCMFAFSDLALASAKKRSPAQVASSVSVIDQVSLCVSVVTTSISQSARSYCQKVISADIERKEKDRKQQAFLEKIRLNFISLGKQGHKTIDGQQVITDKINWSSLDCFPSNDNSGKLSCFVRDGYSTMWSDGDHGNTESPRDNVIKFTIDKNGNIDSKTFEQMCVGCAA
ncbi:MAG: hypothetical protein V4654_04895 [Bdellovibrionota bacterium]